MNSQIGNYGFRASLLHPRLELVHKSGTSTTAFRSTARSTTTTATRFRASARKRPQVYTGGSPAGGTSATLGGYINQVIKTGTFPGYARATSASATPAFYHQAGVEAGGATPDRLFSYYVGVQGTNQTFNTLDNNNGSSQPIDGSGPNGIFGFYYNPVAILFSQTGIGTVVRRVRRPDPPAGSATFEHPAFRSRPATPMRRGRARAFLACRS